MKEKIIIVIMLFFFSSSLSQNINSWIVTSQSGDIETDTMIIEWTLGENFTNTIRFKTKIITEGFLQPQNKTLGLNETKWIKAIVYPNPAQSEIFFKSVDVLTNTSYDIILYDFYGRIISKERQITEKGPLRINVKNLPKGIYLLHITDHLTKQKGVFKFIKN